MTFERGCDAERLRAGAERDALRLAGPERERDDLRLAPEPERDDLRFAPELERDDLRLAPEPERELEPDFPYPKLNSSWWYIISRRGRT